MNCRKSVKTEIHLSSVAAVESFAVLLRAVISRWPEAGVLDKLCAQPSASTVLRTIRSDRMRMELSENRGGLVVCSASFREFVRFPADECRRERTSGWLSDPP